MHFLFEWRTACSFYQKTVWTDVKFLDGSVFRNRIRTEFRCCAHPHLLVCHCPCVRCTSHFDLFLVIRYDFLGFVSSFVSVMTYEWKLQVDICCVTEMQWRSVACRVPTVDVGRRCQHTSTVDSDSNDVAESVTDRYPDSDTDSALLLTGCICLSCLYV